MSKITADGDFSHEIKRCLLLRRKLITNLDSILKSRDITLSTKVRLVKAMVFPVVMYRCESWTIKKAGHWKIYAFELLCWRRLLRVPWTARRSNQSILKEISPGCSLEGWCWSWNSNTLAIWCEELTDWKRIWCWERLRAGGEGDDRGWDGWMASPTLWAWIWVNSRSWWWTGRPGVLRFMRSQRVGHDWATELNWYMSRQLTQSRRSWYDLGHAMNLSGLEPIVDSDTHPWDGGRIQSTSNLRLDLRTESGGQILAVLLDYSKFSAFTYLPVAVPRYTSHQEFMAWRQHRA